MSYPLTSLGVRNNRDSNLLNHVEKRLQNMQSFKTIIVVLVVLALCSVSVASVFMPRVDVLHSQKAYLPGKDYPIAFKIEIPKGLLLHGHEASPAQMLMPTDLSFAPAEGVSIVELQFPAPKNVKLPYSDDNIEVYKGQVLVRGRLHIGRNVAPGSYNIKGTLSYQACTFDSCFPPKKQQILVAVKVVPPGTQTIPLNMALFSRGIPRSNVGPSVTPSGVRLHGGLLLTLLGIFVGGLALNLTPCIYPLIPITVSFFGARSSELRGRKMIHGAMYMGGLAVTNSVLGVSAALTGGILGSALQNPIVLITVSVIILAMGLSFFGLWEMRLPSGIVSAASKGFGGFFGSFFMGLTLGVVAAPCLGPFVLGLLTYVGQRGDALLGFLYFFVLSIGLGLPLGILAVSSGAVDRLPMSGDWLLWIKKGFGWVMVGMAVFMVRPIIPGYAFKVIAIPAVLGAAAFHIGLFDRTRATNRTFTVIKRFLGIGLLIAAVLMTSELWHKDKGIKWVPYRPGILQEARKNGRPAIIDFFAQWCTPCREMDKTTFRDPGVAKLASGLLAVRVDLTTRRTDTQQLVKRFAVKGVPTVIFIRADGIEDRSLRVESHIPPQELARRIRAILLQSQ